MLTIDSFISNYCQENSVEYSEILHESDVHAYCFKKQNRFAVDDLLEALRPALGEYIAEKFNSKSRTLVIISKSAVTEDTFRRIVALNDSDLAKKLDLVFSGKLVEAPLVTKRPIKEADMNQVAAPMPPEQLKQSLFNAIKHVKLGGQPLLNVLRSGGIKCKWQKSGESMANPNAGMTFPYLQFYKDSEAGAVNLLVVDVQKLAESKGMEETIKELVGLANNQGIGSVDATLERAASLKTALSDAAKFAPGSAEQQTAQQAAANPAMAQQVVQPNPAQQPMA